MKHKPREGDLPIEELVDRATKQIQQDINDGIYTDVYFKFTCEHCGARCTFQEPNKVYEHGECAECGKQTVVTVGGYTTVSTLKGKTQ
jgi:hypothetical protein